MRAILAGAVDAIITIDEQGLIETVNTAAERLFGYSGSPPFVLERIHQPQGASPGLFSLNRG